MIASGRTFQISCTIVDVVEEFTLHIVYTIVFDCTAGVVVSCIEDRLIMCT